MRRSRPRCAECPPAPRVCRACARAHAAATREIRDRAREERAAKNDGEYRRRPRTYGWRVANAALLEELKQNPCTDCGKRFPSCAMQFDHLKGKRFGISQAWHRVSTDDLRAELAKCDLVCANCHAVRTVLRSNRYRCWWLNQRKR